MEDMIPLRIDDRCKTTTKQTRQNMSMFDGMNGMAVYVCYKFAFVSISSI